MDDIKVTVYCLAYNHEKYIRKALEGFVMQKTNFDFEIVVHDDASTDKTAEIIREYELKYPNLMRPIYQTENQYSKGVSIKDTFMLPNARGKYIAYCEGDDYWINENKLQMQYDIMESNPDVAMCTHRVQCMNEDCSELKEIIPEPRYGFSGDCFVTSEHMASLLYDTDGYPFHTSSYFVKREVLESNLSLILKGRINGDAVRMRTAMHLGNIYYIDSIMSHRRLWTVGNWNNRMKKLDHQKLIDYRVRNIEGEIIFDDVTGYKFHQWILPNVYQKMYLLLRDYQTVAHSDVIKKYRMKNAFQCLKSKKLTKKIMKYYLWRIRVLLKKAVRC